MPPREVNTKTILALVATLGLGTAAHALTPITSHVDIQFNYLGGGDWLGQYFVATADGGGVGIAADSAFIAVPDIEWQSGPLNEGARFARPAGSSWDFTGVAEGEPLWILTQSDNSIAWAGFRNTQPAGSVASYSSADPRISSTSRPWIRQRVTAVHYYGEGSGGHLSVWQAGQGSQTVWVSTAEGGLTSDDAFFVIENGHDHANWGFGDLGIYIVDMRAEAYLGPGMSNPTQSETTPVIFAVGSYAIWQASHFDLDMLESPAISGDFADPDGDGLVNLLEYALNTSPLAADRSTMEAGVGLEGTPAVFPDDGKLTMEYVRRRSSTNPQVSYRAVFSGSLGTGDDWSESGDVDVSPIDDIWERVRVTDSVAINSESERFARLEVERAED